MEIRITTLCENTATSGFLAEAGLSILVQVDGMNILVDTGLISAALHNAQLLGIDLSTIDKIVLSHGHADHTGGLRKMLRIKKQVDVIAHPDIWDSKYNRRDKQKRERYIGIPFTREQLESLGAQFKLTREPARISEHVLTSGEIPMVSDYEAVDENLYIKKDGIFQHDPLADDLALIIEADFGLVVIMGCAHRGMINTLRHTQKFTGKKSVYAAIGGAHLIGASIERIEKTVNDLKDMGIKKLGLSHCTGFPAQARLFREFGDNFLLNNAGTRIRLPIA